jgi:hypothetical protein
MSCATVRLLYVRTQYEDQCTVRTIPVQRIFIYSYSSLQYRYIRRHPHQMKLQSVLRTVLQYEMKFSHDVSRSTQRGKEQNFLG